MKEGHMNAEDWKGVHLATLDALFFLREGADKKFPPTVIAAAVNTLSGNANYGRLNHCNVIGIMNPFVEAKIVVGERVDLNPKMLKMLYSISSEESPDRIVYARTVLSGGDMPFGFRVPEDAALIRDALESIPRELKTYRQHISFSDYAVTTDDVNARVGDGK